MWIMTCSKTLFQTLGAVLWGRPVCCVFSCVALRLFVWFVDRLYLACGLMSCFLLSFPASQSVRFLPHSLLFLTPVVDLHVLLHSSLWYCVPSLCLSSFFLCSIWTETFYMPGYLCVAGKLFFRLLLDFFRLNNSFPPNVGSSRSVTFVFVTLAFGFKGISYFPVSYSHCWILELGLSNTYFTFNSSNASLLSLEM